MRVKVKFSALIFIILFALLTANAVHAIGVIGNITGTSPIGIVYDSNKSELFVSNDFWSSDGTVSVISDRNNSAVTTIPVGQSPWWMAYDSGTGEIFVTNFGSNTVSVISDSSDKVVATVPVGYEPGSAAYDSSKGEIFVTNYGSTTVSVISDTTNKVVATIPVGFEPYDAAYDFGKGEIFVTLAGWPGSVSVISDSTNSVIANISVGRIPEGVAYDSGKGEIFVANYYDSTVSVISDNSNSVIATIQVGISPNNVVYDSHEGEIFVSFVGAFEASGSLSVISDSNNTVIATVPVGNQNVSGMAYDSGKGEILVVNGVISVVSDSSTLTAPTLFAFPSMIGLGQTSKLTSSVVTSGNPPYTYQWFSEAPGASSFSLVSGASPVYTFATSNSAVEGNWKFILQVTGFNGGSVNSTAASVIVTAPPLDSATSNTRANGGSATLDMSAFTGVNVTVSGSLLQNGTVINAASADYGDEQPNGTGVISVGVAVFYDVSVASNNGALGSDVYASVSITNPSFTGADVMEYWNGTSYVSVATTFAAPDTVTGTFPASALSGTPIVVGTAKTVTSFRLSLLELIYGFAIGLTIAIFTIGALMFMLKAKKRKASVEV